MQVRLAGWQFNDGREVERPAGCRQRALRPALHHFRHQGRGPGHLRPARLRPGDPSHPFLPTLPHFNFRLRLQRPTAVFNSCCAFAYLSACPQGQSPESNIRHLFLNLLHAPFLICSATTAVNVHPFLSLASRLSLPEYLHVLDIQEIYHKISQELESRSCVDCTCKVVLPVTP